MIMQLGLSFEVCKVGNGIVYKDLIYGCRSENRNGKERARDLNIYIRPVQNL